MKPGIFDAKVVDYGVSKTKKGDPMAMIRFCFIDESSAQQFINWYGTFVNEKAAEITCDTLAICGWSTNNPADLAKGAGSGVLDEIRTVSITLANEEYQGKVTTKVKYVNPPGGAGFREKLEQADAIQAFAGMNLGAVAAKARANQAKKPIKNYAPGASTEEPIPF